MQIPSHKFIPKAWNFHASAHLDLREEPVTMHLMALTPLVKFPAECRNFLL